MKRPHAACSYFVQRSSSSPARRASFFRSTFSEPSGTERLSASNSLATVEEIGPSSEASAASQSCSRRLMIFSGIGCASQIEDVRAVRLEPIRVSVAQLALFQWPALTIGAAMKEGRRCSISGPCFSERAYSLMPATESNLRSTPATPAATLRPVVPSMLSGCSAIDPSIPPTSTLPPIPNPTVALAVAPP